MQSMFRSFPGGEDCEGEVKYLDGRYVCEFHLKLQEQLLAEEDDSDGPEEDDPPQE